MEKIRLYLFEYLPGDPFVAFEFFSGFIPIIFCLIFFKKVWPNNKILVVYSIVILIFEITANVYSAFSKNNHWIYIIFYMLESTLLSYYYISQIGINSYKKAVKVLLIIILLGFLINLFYENNNMNNTSSTLQGLVFIMLSLFNFYFILENSSKIKIFDYPFFWVNSGFLIYYSGKFFVSLFIKEITNFNTNLIEYWNIASIMIILLRVFVTIGISKSHNIFKKSSLLN